MRAPLLISFALGAAVVVAAVPAAAEVSYVVRIADVNRVGLTLGNYGFFGNNLTSRNASFEFPLGSGYEHMSRAGLWVGARALDEQGVFTGVSAAIVDNSQGTSGPSETEFTPLGDALLERSRIQNSPRYSPLAVSDQDLIAWYADQPAKPSAGFQREPHRPLKLRVKQESLGFTLPVADGFVVTRFTLYNEGSALQDVYVALYAQLVSGNREAYSSWPPSSSTGPGSWYYRTHFEYDGARNLVMERYCQARPVPDLCNVSYCPPWVGIKLLRTRSTPQVSPSALHRWWVWSPGDTTRDEDFERYRLMSGGGEPNPADCPLDGSCSPIQLLSVGPFPRLEAGDSLTVDFAYVGGDDKPQLLANSDYAQFAAGIDYKLPSAPPSPRVHVETGHGRVDIWWDDSPESATDATSPAPGGRDFEGYRVYLGLDREAPTRVAQFDLADTTGFNTGLEPALAATPLVVDGVTYRYRRTVLGLKDGFRYYGAVTSYDQGDVATPALESGISQNKFAAIPVAAPGERAGGATVFPNPYRVEAQWDAGSGVRDRFVWFAGLPRRCKVSVYTLSGDRVLERDFNGDTYSGDNARGVYDPRLDRDTGAPALSGGAFAWNLITARGQAAASGLYLWVVEDLDGGNVQRGKLLLVKSDKE